MLVAIVLGTFGFIFILFVWSVCVVGGKADDIMERAARERERAAREREREEDRLN